MPNTRLKPALRILNRRAGKRSASRLPLALVARPLACEVHRLEAWTILDRRGRLSYITLLRLAPWRICRKPLPSSKSPTCTSAIKRRPRPVFAGLNLTVRAGERLTILGPSEAGKSTLALCLQGLIPRLIKGDLQGRIEVAGVDTRSCRPRELAARVGLLFQDFEAQLFCTRVDQEVAFGPENLALPQDELRRRVAHSLGLVGLAGLEARNPAALSGGQRQLLALAAVLALEPRLLILDEPTSDLDPLRVEELLRTLDRLAREQGLTLVLLGQDLRLARNCSRLVLLQQGEILADGVPSQVLRRVELFRQLGLQVPELPGLFHDLGQTHPAPHPG